MKKIHIDIDKAKALYEDGCSLSYLAYLFGVSPHTVAARLRENGVPVRGRPHHIESFDLDKARKRYYEDGLSLEQVGREMDISSTKVLDEFARAGLKPRGAWDYYANEPARHNKKGKDKSEDV